MLRIFGVVITLTIITNLSAQKDAKLDSLLSKYKLLNYKVNNSQVLVYQKDVTPKPTIIFIAGSGFNPIFVNGKLYYFPFDIYKYGSDFNFVIMSKPGIPLYADSISNKFINQTFEYSYFLNNKGEVPESFVKNNNCNFYVSQYSDLINFLNKQSWVIKNNVFVIGHSQGARVASSLSSNKSVKGTIVLSPGSIYSRFQESIRTIRIEESFGQINPKSAQKRIDSIYSRYYDLLRNKNDNKKLFDGSTYFSYYSFNFPSTADKICKTKKRTLIVYGTASFQDLDCDYIKLELANHKNKNVDVKALIGYDHNFFEDISDDKGNFKERKYHWNDVMDSVIVWIKKPN